MLKALENLGARTVETLEATGNFGVFAAKTLAGFAAAAVSPRRWRGLPHHMFSIGVMSVPMVMLTGLFVGMVLAVGSFNNFAALGMAEKIGGLINGAVVKEVGPVLAATMLAGRVGGALTAELGTMRVTEQIDALRVMGTDPIRQLSVPRFLGCFLMIPFLTAYTDIAGMVGGYVIVVGYFGVGSEDYINNCFVLTYVYDVWTGLAKSLFFGATIGLVSCYKGFHCGPGAAGVGRACTEAFVASFAAVLAENFLLAVISKELWDALGGEKSTF
jgi:phospholipid/cholesterol/gamma-HCH transport system permease protein